MLSVELCGSASTFKFEILTIFSRFLAVFVLTENFKVTYIRGRIPSEIFLIPGMDKGIAG